VLSDLKFRIHRRTATIGVIGLGYVGLSVACRFTQEGFPVVGVDIKPDRIAMIRHGQSPLSGNEPGLFALIYNAITTGRLCCSTEYRSPLEFEQQVLAMA
jgi:UDP-N-acetyl-D-mannosaminuronate dehydrogenase